MLWVYWLYVVLSVILNTLAVDQVTDTVEDLDLDVDTDKDKDGVTMVVAGVGATPLNGPIHLNGATRLNGPALQDSLTNTAIVCL